jgi:hypothetical protein
MNSLEPTLILKWLPNFTVRTYRKKLRKTFFQPSVYGWYRAKTNLYLYLESSKTGLTNLLRREHPIIQPDEENFYTDEIHVWWDSPLIYTFSFQQFKQLLIQSFGYTPEFNRRDNNVETIPLSKLIEINVPLNKTIEFKPRTYIKPI